MQVLRARHYERAGINSFTRFGLLGLIFSFASIILSGVSFIHWVSKLPTTAQNTSRSNHSPTYTLAKVENTSENTIHFPVNNRFSYIAPTDYGKNLPFRDLFEDNWEFYETNDSITEYSFVVEPIYQPKFVYVFVNLENGFTLINNQSVNGTQIGRVDFEFSGTATLSYSLIAGNNIREWLIGAPKNIVSTTIASNTYQAYAGKHYKDETMTGISDVIVIGFENLPANAPLIKIKICDESFTALASENPRLLIMGVVVEQ